MHLNKAQAVLRPRNPWEAIDLGVLLARRHSALLMATWAVLTLPLFAILTVIFWQQPSVAVLVIWWLKPAFERLPLYILSNALFANTPSLRDSFKALPKLLKPQLLASLTWRRLSVTRSFDLPVLQLENLSGPARQQRLVTLGRNYTRAPTWLTIIGLHIEMALWISLLALLYLFIPAQLQTDWSWAKLLQISQSQWLWAEHLSNLLYVLVLIIWEPIYVACGFTLYLNRRTELEAWDIELALRNLAKRLTSSLGVFLCALLLLLPLSDNAFAQSFTQDNINTQNQELGVEQPRLLKQMLNSEQAQQSIKATLDAPPFENYKTISNWQLGKSKTDTKDTHEFNVPDWLKNLVEYLSFSVQVVLWSTLLLLSALLLWRYRQWLSTFAQKLRPIKKAAPPPVQTLFALEVNNQSLPDDLIASAQSLWSSDQRAALSLLYRGFLNYLLQQQTLPLTAAHTENEVLAMTDALDPKLQLYGQQLTQYWINLAWGHRLPAHSQFVQLCQQWQELQQQEHSQ